MRTAIAAAVAPPPIPNGRRFGKSGEESAMASSVGLLPSPRKCQSVNRRVVVARRRSPSKHGYDRLMRASCYDTTANQIVSIDSTHDAHLMMLRAVDREHNDFCVVRSSGKRCGMAHFQCPHRSQPTDDDSGYRWSPMLPATSCTPHLPQKTSNPNLSSSTESSRETCPWSNESSPLSNIPLRRLVGMKSGATE
jgi:hypothetical protein